MQRTRKVPTMYQERHGMYNQVVIKSYIPRRSWYIVGMLWVCCGYVVFLLYREELKYIFC